MGSLGFQLEREAAGSRARAGRFRTLHTEVLTPLFMPVGTHATVRAQRQDSLLESGSQILLANTYHLFLRPGLEVFRQFKGIHNFMKWPRGVLTDSGGFQIFCMAKDIKMSEEGARFLSYVDGKHILLTPELSIEAQKTIGSDIMMVLDQCIPSAAPWAESREAMLLTERWAKRSLAARGDSAQAMFGIIQGACFQDLRKESVERICALPMDGFALGGLAVGEQKSEREDTTAFTTELMPKHLPRYLMGVGTPIDLLEAVHRGVDMFDCIIPTAFAQQGTAFTLRGKINLRRGVYKLADEPLDSSCDCYTCTTHSRAYLHHLVKAKEAMAWHWVGLHNIHFYHSLMRSMREAILQDRFLALYKILREPLARTDEENPVKRPQVSLSKEPPLELGDYEIVSATDALSHIRQKSSGEIMHPLEDPFTEAKTLYVAQSHLIQRLQEGPITLWDVGMGAATNAMAAIFAYEEAKKSGVALYPLQIESFERDLDSLRLAILHPRRFRHICHGAPHTILKSQIWRSKDDSILWKLHEGDFFERCREATLPEIVFFDPFSHKVDQQFWTAETVRLLWQICSQHAVAFYTYSSSTRIRAEFLAVGFFVAEGLGSGYKKDTTVLLTPKELGCRASKYTLLADDWWQRLEKSTAPISADIRSHLQKHPQFSKMLSANASG